MSITITTRLERRIEANPRGLTIIETIRGKMIQAALTPDEARQIAAALTADQGGQWTAADFPDEGEFADLVRKALSGAIRESGKDLLPGTRLRAIRDLLAQWMNAHHPKPEQAMVPARPITRADLPDLHPWLTEGAIDQVIEHINDRGGLGIDAREPLERALRERDAAVARADQLRDERDEALSAGLEALGAAERERDEWKARAEAAEAVGPVVTREDVEKAIDRWKLTGQSRGATLADDMHALLSGDDPAVFVVRESDLPHAYRDECGDWATSTGKGERCGRASTAKTIRRHVTESLDRAARMEAIARAIEAEQAVDPVEAKARELYEVGNPGTAGMWESIHEAFKDGYRRIARHVLGQEADHA